MNIINGDCLEKLKTLKEKSIDLAILDLPNGQTDCDWDIKINLDELWKELKRVGKPNTPYFFFTTTKFGYELIKSNEKWFRYDLVWNKPNSGAGFLLARKMPMRSHEMIYVFYNKLPFYNIEDNHKMLEIKEDKEHINSSLYITNSIVRQKGKSWEPKLPKSILEYGIECNTKKRLHQTQKPVGILEWIIKYYSKEGDTILDPTMGSGSTGEACLNLKRNFIGIEMNKDIFDVASKRLTK